MIISTGLAILFLGSTAQAQTGIGQASNFNISKEVASSYGCNETCQEVLAITNAADLGTLGTAFDFDFYATADNFSTSTPGDLLKIAAINSSHLDVPAGMTTFRFQYTSRDLDGSPVPSTGFIAFPFAKPANGRKLPLVAYAHGTIGVFRGCAPSSSPSFFNYDSWVPLLYRGYAIVGTDYAGLGNNFTSHKYSSYAAHANDLYYSVQAARKAFPVVFTKEWMSIGHSQGGGAVWKLSEHPLVQKSSSGYLGTVAVSPGAKLYDTAKVVFDSIFPRSDFHQFVVTAEMGMLTYGVMQAFPNYTAPWLGEAMNRRISLATLAQSCTLAFMGMSFDLSREELIVSAENPAADETLKQFQAINAPAQGDSASRPLLVIHGWNDTSVLPENTLGAYHDAVAAGNEVHLLRYPGLDHSATLTSSAPEWLEFLDNQFARKRGRGASTDRTVQPFDLAVAKTPLELPLNEEPLLGFLG
ncbi:Alpha/Beta hydrolase protein [Dactylonectria estremocensis]|uniref:Alpha/Beta hydrolase protein n=1 Tax=Dactylonectria estremocensis TaxID=1079267 RepID=A0A9P9J3Y0_9HYPO|nr:Alpha/Beta hydrolase protein [Dactylonectria estremocensis]